VIAGPLLFGGVVGFTAVLLGIRRWFHTQSATPSGDILTLARRLGLRATAGALLVTALATPWLARTLERPLPEVMQGALVGVPLGLAAGLHFTLRRGGTAR